LVIGSWNLEFRIKSFNVIASEEKQSLKSIEYKILNSKF